jgi:hypothetical protein
VTVCTTHVIASAPQLGWGRRPTCNGWASVDMKAKLNDFDASLKTGRVERQIDRVKIVSECQKYIPIPGPES